MAGVQLIGEVVDPFSMSDAIKARGTQILQRVAAPAHGGRGTAGQRLVTVVLIDDRYYRTQGEGAAGVRPIWPLPASTLVWGVIAPILRARPQALFVDLVFPDAPRESEPGTSSGRVEAETRLGEWLKLAAKSSPDVPLLLATGFGTVPAAGGGVADRCDRPYVARGTLAESSLVAPPLLTALASADGGGMPANVEIVDVAVAGPEGYILAPSMTGPRGDCRNQEEAHGGYIASPALALYLGLGRACTAKAAAAGLAEVCAGAAGFEAGVKRAPTTDGPGVFSYSVGSAAKGKAIGGTLAPRWGVTLRDETRDRLAGRAGGDACTDQIHEASSELIRMYLRQLTKIGERLFADQIERPCVYIDTLSAGDLLDQRQVEDAHGADEVREKYIKDRIVLLSASIPQAGDRMMSPVNGNIPGVYQHAVALENLITRGGRYARVDHGPLHTTLLFVGGVIVVVGMTLAWECLLHEGRRLRGWPGELIFAPMIYYALLVVVAWLVLRMPEFVALPLGDLALLLVSVHVIFFAGWLERLRLRVEIHYGLREPTEA